MSKIALITGGTRGIGKAIAEKFKDEGIIVEITNRENADVSDFDSCGEFVKKIFARHGRIDILVNNAGITNDSLFLRMSKEDFTKVIDVNLIGTFNMTKHVIPIMVKQRYGKIINMASVVGIVGNAGQANYAASKAGIIGITKTLAKEFASRNINVNAVAPGFIETDMTNVLKAEIKEEILKKIPLKRMGNVDDVANLVKFLASDESNYITGQIINIDGGMI